MDHATRIHRIDLSISCTYAGEGQVSPLQLKGHKRLAAEDRNQKRLARLRSMEKTRTYNDACQWLRQIRDAGELRPDQILIRSGFARRSQPLDTEAYSDRSVPERARRPPATRLLRSRGCALQFFLTALFEAQCRTPPGRIATANTRPLKPVPRTADQASWVDLVGPSADTAPIVSGYRAINARERGVRQVRQALLTLAGDDVRLVEFTKPDSLRRYDRFRLLHEAGREVPYAVPTPTGQNLFSLDARLFTNGWVNVLKDTELAFLCMVADLQARNGGDDPVDIDGYTRIGHYGLGTDGYQAHHLLQKAGLLQVTRAEVRRPDGTFKAPDHKAPYDLSGGPNSFRLVSNGFSQSALPAIIQALHQF